MASYPKESNENDDDDHYKIIFKNYKNINFELFESIIDCNNIEKSGEKVLLDEQVSKLKYSFEELDSICKRKNDFKPYDEWKVYKPVQSIDGVLIIPGILKPECRQEWFEYFHDTLPANKDLKANIDLNSNNRSGLRWVTFGYHHDWNTKHYTLEQQTVIIPDRIQDLSTIVSNYLGLNSFKAEAGIVNYYNRKSSLYFHTDHSEVDHTIPLISVSLGSPAIFLIGGLTKHDSTPITPILLGDSDVLIMSQQSRLALHAVPKIFSPKEFDILTSDYDKKTDESSLSKPKKKRAKIDLGDKSTIYRININVRQVFPAGKNEE